MSCKPSFIVGALIGFVVAGPMVLTAQSSISTDGVIESKSGGFIFPDGTLQASAGAAGRAPVAATGQTKCYDPTGATADEIACAGTGQDGEIQAGVAWPSPRFTDNSDGTVTDNLTMLVWLKDADCTDVTPPGFAETLTSAATLASGVCGLSDGSVAGDWRVPNIREFLSLLDFSQPGGSSLPLPPGHPFLNTAGTQAPWATTTLEGNEDVLWQFSQAILSNTSKSNATERFWAVRDMVPPGAAAADTRPFQQLEATQTSISTDGAIETTDGGLLFPDGTVQASAASQSSTAASAPAPVADTGQQRCYDPSGTTSNEIACLGTGQDGEFQQGVAAPTPRFRDNGDGTVTDGLTGLIWLKDSYCEDGFSQYVSFVTALATVASLADGTCGLTDGSSGGDWRLPNINEFLSLADYGHLRNSVNRMLAPGHPFLNVGSEEYWSSTSSADDPTSTYIWDLGFGNASPFGSKNGGTYAIWAVRGPE